MFKLIDQFNIDELILWSLRYLMGRRTIAACSFALDLAKAYKHLPIMLRAKIRDEVESRFLEDNLSRKRKASYHPLGDDCDREAWLKVRACYMADEDLI